MDTIKHTILYVDDERANRVVMKHSLAGRFTVVLASSGAEALEVLQRQPIAVLLSDQRMPEMSGVDLLEIARQRFPDAVRVIITAYSDLDSTVDAINRGGVSRFLKKPWTREELWAVLADCIHTYRQARLLEETRQKLIRTERLSTLGVLVSSLAHDLRQPLSYIEPNLVMALEDFNQFVVTARLATDAPGVVRLREALSDALEGIRTCVISTARILERIRGRDSEALEVTLGELVDSVIALLGPLVRACASLSVQISDTARGLAVSSGRLDQLLVNLLFNAVQATPPGASHRHRISLRLVTEGQRLIVEVEDTGVGIPPALHEEIFTPFFTTRGEDGTGLGLAICKAIVQEQGGRITVSSDLNRGALFRVELPLDEP